MTPDVCPHCGADVPANAKACPACGSDETTGWSQEARTNGLDLPEEDFDYEDFLQREFGSKRPIPRGIHWIWWVIALAVIIALVALWSR